MSKECVNCIVRGNIYICRNCEYYSQTNLVNNYKPKTSYCDKCPGRENPLHNGVCFCPIGRLEVKGMK